MRSTTETDIRRAFTLRGLERSYGISRNRIAEAIHSGELRARRVGKRRFTILRDDFEQWLDKYTIDCNHQPGGVDD